MSPSTISKQELTSPAASARKQFVIAQRDPWRLPDDKIELSAPGPSVGPPPNVNWVTTLLPPALMSCGTILLAFFGTTGLLVALPMLMMSMGFPAASLISFGVQKKKHIAAVKAREAAYRQKLRQEYAHIKKLIETQRDLLLREYPALDGLLRITLEESFRRERLWVRRPHDADFLSLRIGLGPGKPSFSVTPPQVPDQNDPLVKLAGGVLATVAILPDLPVLVPLAKAGSLAISSRSLASAYAATRHLLLELLVHHSPQDVQLVVLADSDNAHERWDWLKWTPHTQALESEDGVRRLAFNPNTADAILEWLRDESNRRRKQGGGLPDKAETLPAIVVLLDDTGKLRQSPTIAQLASSGMETGIYLIFAGAQSWPRECRARLEVAEDGFRYIETWGGEGEGLNQEGTVELAGMAECESITRALAGLAVTGSHSVAVLPDSIRISEVLGPGSLYIETLKQRWTQTLTPRDQLQFPVGVTVSRDEIEPVMIDLRPEGLGGKQAFHTVLIGTTGSGKSVFLQSLVLGAAYRYSPRHLNILLMDFKAGASELGKLKELPHVVGLVTDLGPELAERALVAIDSEIQRRKGIFEEAGKISDIWAYNQRFPDQPLPHLLLVLDEFSKGVELLPDLQKVLQTLATQGRALGMYLLLANQKVNSAVDALLANIGWRIALRVAERDEMRIVDPSLAPTRRPGRGYVRVKEDVFEFQGTRSDQPVSTKTEETEEFSIQEVGPDGSRSLLYKQFATEPSEAGADLPPALSEVETLVGLMKQAANELGYQPARRIYMDPLPARISLDQTLTEAGLEPAFKESAWRVEPSGHLLAPLGFVDYPRDCLQQPLQVDFAAQDGHLWLVGAPGSGKEMALASVLLSLAATHTPQEVQFYILEYGDGSLRPFDALPHTGAVIRLPEQERLERLLSYLESELERRTAASGDGQARNDPALFLVINNFAELRQSYPDHSERLSRFVRDGRTAGIHLILSSNRGIELTRSISSNIARRLVLQLASRDEYMDVIGRMVPLLGDKSEGRGYWVDGAVAECQVAQPALAVIPGGDPLEVRELGKVMRTAWSGPLPVQIATLPTCIPLAEMLAKTKQPKNPQDGLYIPVGVAHESLQLLKANLQDELPSWLILGPRRCGKSNFLACAAATILESTQPNWQVYVFGLRRSPLVDWARKQERLLVAASTEEALRLCQEITSLLDSPAGTEKRLMLLLDDLGAAFEVGKETVGTALNNLATRCGSCNNVFILAAGLVDELRSQMASPLVRLLRQSRTGLGLTKEATELDWLGYQPSLQVRKLELTPGRGFWVTRGKACLVQTPLLGSCPPGK